MEVLLNILLFCTPLILLSWTLPERWQLWPVSIGTALFLAYWAPVSLAILLFSGMVTYFMLRRGKSIATATIIVIAQLGIIFLFFKLQYGQQLGLLQSRIIPLGLSFYSFRQIHYAIEVYKNKLPVHSIWDYFQYLFFLPTLLVGPINRFQPFLRDMKRRRWDKQLFSAGLERILYGLAKIVILGNYLFSTKLPQFIANLEAGQLWLKTYLEMVQFAANSYVQFAGYSEVAIGLSLLLGFRVMENFNAPYWATNIADFWTRWHISLSEWCRDYVYYPILAISRNGRISIIASMLVLGGWHEISWRYLIWGGLHALAINLWYQYRKTALYITLSRLPFLQKALGILITLHFVMLSFVIIKEDSLSRVLEIYQILFGIL